MLPVSGLPERPRIASKLAPTRAEWRSRSLSVRVSRDAAAASVAVTLRTGVQPRPARAVAERDSRSGRREHSRHVGLTSRSPWPAVRRPRAPSFVLPVSGLPERPRIASKLAPTGAGRRSRSLSVRAAYVGASLLAIKGPPRLPLASSACCYSAYWANTARLDYYRFSARNTKLRPWASAAAFWLYMGRAQQLKPWSTPG